MQKYKSREKADSTSQHSCSDKPSDKQKKTKLVRIIVRLLSDWRRTAVGLRTDSCPYRRRTAVGQQTDSCRTTGKHPSSPPTSPFSGFYLSNSYENERLKKATFSVYSCIIRALFCIIMQNAHLEQAIMR